VSGYARVFLAHRRPLFTGVSRLRLVSARSAATNLKSRPPLGQKSLVLACGLTYQTVSNPAL